jgi:hypothetical protein
MAQWQLAGELVLWITHLSGRLHGRLAGRLVPGIGEVLINFLAWLR